MQRSSVICFGRLRDILRWGALGSLSGALSTLNDQGKRRMKALTALSDFEYGFVIYKLGWAREADATC